jgi:hypothetical protein
VRARTGVLLSLVVLGCLRQAAAPPPVNPGPVIVLPPHDRTGDALVVSGTSLLEQYAFASPRVTVGDVLAAELRAELARRGVAVVAPEAVEAAAAGREPDSPAAAVEIARSGGLDGSVLYIEIVCWEPEGGAHPAFVIAGVHATLTAVRSGAVLWQARRAPTPVATPGAVTPGSASVMAAREIAAALLTGWSP